MTRKAIVLAQYLPQYYPIPENDTWWGKGFTEWTNTTKGKPLFKGHHQPNLPADLGFYDLRVPETREHQAKLASDHGITGFAYWHYWFGNGRTILTLPFSEVLKSKRPGLPFCLAWANESWTGIWHGLENKVLIEQTYPGSEDHKIHFEHVLPAFQDERYIKIDNKPLFIVYLPHKLPDAKNFTGLWNELAVRNGFNGMYFIGIHYLGWDHKADGFDEKSVHPLHQYIGMFEKDKKRKFLNNLRNQAGRKIKNTYRYSDLVDNYDYSTLSEKDFVPSILPNWDNTSRSGKNGFVIEGSTPDLFCKHIKSVFEMIFRQNSNLNNIILLKSWNEWAEGNYLEPDQQWGMGYLEAIRDVTNQLDIITKYR